MSHLKTGTSSPCFLSTYFLSSYITFNALFVFSALLLFFLLWFIFIFSNYVLLTEICFFMMTTYELANIANMTSKLVQYDIFY